MIKFKTLLKKELLRFYKVGFQTLAAPILTSMLYLFVFSHILSDRVEMFDEINYVSFLIPGLAMMTILQNAFANSSSSIIQSKVTGNLIFVLLSPINYIEFFFAYLTASCIRGLIVGAGVVVVTSFFYHLPIFSILWIIIYAFLGAGILANIGIIAGICSNKFEEIAFFQNFLIMPLTFLSGVFYSVQKLPEIWQLVSYFNPFFYMIDGFRYGFLGKSDSEHKISFIIVFTVFLVLSFVTILIIKKGYKLKN